MKLLIQQVVTHEVDVPKSHESCAFTHPQAYFQKHGHPSKGEIVQYTFELEHDDGKREFISQGKPFK